MKGLKVIVWIIFWIAGGTPAFSQIGFPYCESFQTPNTQAKTIFGGNARLINGVLRLTENINDQRGFVYIDVPFPSTYGLKVEFEFFIYGGTGLFQADGLSMFLFDGDATSFFPGGFGGSLGYAQRGSEPGLSNAYLGVGFDVFGNFGTTIEGKIGGFSALDQNGRAPNSIVLRGPGNGLNGYPFVVGRKTMEVGSDKDGFNPGAQFPISSGGSGTSRVTDPKIPGYRRVNLELQPNPDGVGFFLSLSMLVTTQENLPREVTIFDRPFYFPAPKNLKIGFAASTGGFNNFHEIRNLKVEVSADNQLKDPQGIDLQDFTSCAGQENQFFIKDEDVTLPNENSTIRCLQFFKSKEEIEINEGDVCTQARCLEQNRFLVLPEGIFRASDNAGGFTFTPNEEFIGKKVTVYYTITDNYGKTSSGNSITLDINASPKPINLLIQGENEIRENVQLCPSQTAFLEGIGEEEYVRYEWLKNGEILPNQTGSSLFVSEGGSYEIRAFNAKGCPVVSNSILVEYPKTPELTFSNPLVACLPGSELDVTAIIPGFDPVKYDYLLTGQGIRYSNLELRKVNRSGTYQLQVKLKSLDCYSEPVQLTVVIREEELIADFDFTVEGTDIKDDSSGGIFPDDPIEFSVLEDSEIIQWNWEFGDGKTSTEANPIHVFGKKGEFRVRLTVTDSLGCSASVEKTVVINRSYRVMFPTGFTPLDSQNATFLPKWKGLANLELLIFNTWGELIFQSDELETKGWDGTFEGKLQDAGVYFFRFNGTSIDREVVRESGKFRLIR
ncbi:PKD domain-containing protein [Algoriphagus sp. AK58]|uniref:PKD domain-containing protein n=1 Tax=Algoriphagus sp. AK58 TaxID=1406877 RepID=UPI00351C347D